MGVAGDKGVGGKREEKNDINVVIICEVPQNTF